MKPISMSFYRKMTITLEPLLATLELSAVAAAARSKVHRSRIPPPGKNYVDTNLEVTSREAFFAFVPYLPLLPLMGIAPSVVVVAIFRALLHRFNRIAAPSTKTTESSAPVNSCQEELTAFSAYGTYDRL